MHWLNTLWVDSREKVSAVLLVLWAAALLHQFRAASLWHGALSVLLALLFDMVFVWARSKRWTLSPSSLVTGLLIGMLLDPNSGLVAIAVACFLASGSKAFISRGAHRHAFNPAAFGVLSASWIFHQPVAWWGSSWGMVPVVIVSAGMLPVLRRLRRLASPTAFVAVYFLSHVLTASVQTAVRLTVDGTVFLFALVMLPEPRTSPAAGPWRWGWGVAVGALVAAQNFFKLDTPDPLLLALLAANLLAFIVPFPPLAHQGDNGFKRPPLGRE